MDCNQSCWHKCHNFARWSYNLKWKWNCPRALELKNFTHQTLLLKIRFPGRLFSWDLRTINGIWIPVSHSITIRRQNHRTIRCRYICFILNWLMYFYFDTEFKPLIHLSMHQKTVYHGWCSMLQVAAVSHPFRNCWWQHWNWWCWDGSEGPWKPWMTKQNPQDKKLIPNLWHTSLL